MTIDIENSIVDFTLMAHHLFSGLSEDEFLTGIKSIRPGAKVVS